jgi:hypothetical protein
MGIKVFFNRKGRKGREGRKEDRKGGAKKKLSKEFVV